MKKVSLVLLLLLAAPSLAKAEPLSIGEIVKNLPAIKQGIAYSIADSKINYLATMEIIKWKGFALEGGYAGWAENTGAKAVGVVSYHLANLQDMGVDVPLAKYVDVNVGVYFGVGEIGGGLETDYGVSATAISLKF